VTTAERILAAAAEMTADAGWSEVTMSAIAQRVGVSRQTVYNEWGSRDRLAEAMVLRELGAFLAEVDAGFDDHPSDLGAALTCAIARVLELARVNPLLRSIVTATHGAQTELVPLLTTRADVLMATAHARVRERVTAYPRVKKDLLETKVDLLVRTVLSHVMQPLPQREDMAEELGQVTARMLR
jgi:AcrR family transcriptional regulator